MIRNIYSALIIIFLSLTSFVANTQNKSVGGVYDAQNKVIWLKAEDLMLTNGSPVDLWQDQSGKSNDAYMTNPDSRPVFVESSSFFNNKPVISFNESGQTGQMLIIDDSENLAGMSELTIIAVIRNSEVIEINGGLQGIIAKSTNYLFGNQWSLALERLNESHPNRLDFMINNKGSYKRSYTHTDDAMIHSGTFNGPDRQSVPSVNILGARYNETAVSVRSDGNRDVIIGNTAPTNDNWFKGEIAEIIVIREALNSAQRLILENILALKYDAPITGNPERYFLGNFKDSGYEHDIIGIGRGNQNTTLSDATFYKFSATQTGGAGLYLTEVANTLDQINQFVFAGHNNVAHGTTTDGLPTGEENEDLEERWNRVWRVERTIPSGIGSGTSVRLGFDFEEAELDINSNSIYVLLYKENESDEFVRLPLATAPSGNQVIFTVSDELFNTGYYTVAKSEAEIKTWVSVQSGLWNNPATWGELSAYPGLDFDKDRADNIEINNSHTIIIDHDGYSHGDLWIKTGGKLVINETRDHSFNTIRGKGRIQIIGDYFPAGDLSNFTKKDAGTVVFVGSEDYDLSTSRTFNNIEINLNNPDAHVTLLSNLTLNGNLTVQNGILRINNESTTKRELWIDGNLSVGNSGQILTGTGNTRHSVTIRGNLTNNGVIRFSNLDEPSYQDYPTNGMSDVYFNSPTGNQIIQANGLTEFYRIEIAKSKTDTLFLRANSPNRFYLMGRNDYRQSGFVANYDNPNALGLLSGVLVLENNIHIPKLKSREPSESPPNIALGNYFIDLNAQIVLNGGKLETPSNIWAIAIWGALVVLDGELSANGSEGVTLYDSGRFEISGGLAKLNIFRTSVTGGTHRGTFIQSGGDVIIDGIGGNSSYYRFSLAYRENFFSMTGGNLIVKRTRNSGDGIHGGILINAQPSNQIVTGGTVTGEINNNVSFIINSSAPFYNLELIRTSSNQEAIFYIAPYPGGSVGFAPPPGVEAYPLRVLNNMIISGGDRPATFDINGYELSINGMLKLESGASLVGPGSTLSFNGSSNTSFEIEDNEETPEIGTLRIQKEPPENRFKLFRSYENGNNEIIVINELLEIESGNLDYNQYTVRLLGNLFLNGNLGMDVSGGKILMNGTMKQTITVPPNQSNTFIEHLKINNSHNISLTGNSIAEINTLTLSEGIFDLGIHGITITGKIQGSGFGPEKMIATAGNHSNIGLSIMLKQNGELFFPIGTTAGSVAKFTPLEAHFSNVFEEGLITINPVNSELNTLAGGEENMALKYYWRVRHGFTQNLPLVDHYIFHYNAADLPDSVPPGFVPGKIVSFERKFEKHQNFNAIQKTLLFDNNQQPFILENGEYTAADESKFEGNVKIFYSRESTNPDNPSPWESTSTWTFNPLHEGDEAGEIPGPGDIVIIGGDWEYPHAISVNTDINIAGLIFNYPDIDLPLLLLANSDITANLGMISGEGSLAIALDSSTANVIGDFTDFLMENRSEIIYIAQNNGTHVVPSNIQSYPNLTLWSANPEGSTMLLPDTNLLVRGSLTISQNANAIISNKDLGDIVIMGDLRLGDQNDMGTLLFQGTGESRLLDIRSSIILQGNNDTYLGVENLENDLTHKVKVGEHILHQNGAIQFFHSETNPRVLLEISGTEYGEYTRHPDIQEADFYRIIMNKGNNNTYLFSMKDNFNIYNVATGAEDQKPIYLLNGTLDLAGLGTDITLNEGSNPDGRNFLIPSTAGLILRGNVIIRANGNRVNQNELGIHSGISLDGLLRVQDNAKVFMADHNDSKASIEYSPSGNARLEVLDNAFVEIAGHIRGYLDNDNNVLKYHQNGGTVIVGVRAGATPVFYFRGVFEIHNPGSTFEFLSGDLIIGRDNMWAEGQREALFLAPPNYTIGTDATIYIGMVAGTPPAGIINVFSTIDLPNLIIREGTAWIRSNNSTIKGNLTINNGKTLNVEGLTLNLKSDFINNGNFAGTNSTIVFKGETQIISGSTSTTFHNLTIDPGTDFSNPEVGLYNNIHINGDLKILSGRLNSMGHEINVYGHVFNNGLQFSSETTGGINFQGTTFQQTISGGGEFGRLNINNEHGVLAHNPITINEELIISHGVLDIQTNLLTLGPNCFISPEVNNYNFSRMIRSRGDLSSSGVKRTVHTSEQFLFPIGVGSKYTPVQIKINDNDDNISITINPINHKHVNITSDENLNYYWSIHSGNTFPSSGEILLHYHQSDVGTGDESVYYPATLTGDTWIKLPKGNNDQQNNIITFPVSADISGDYTLGSDIPDQVMRYQTTSDGNWWESGIWENVTPGYAPDDIPEIWQGPLGQIVTISHTIFTGTSRRIAHRTTLNGVLTVNASETLNHHFGTVEGTGKIVMDDSTLPIGDYTQFAKNGTFEYSGAANYSIDPAQLPAEGINNIIFSGSGSRKLPAGELFVNGNFELRDNVDVVFNTDESTLRLRGDLIKNMNSTLAAGLGNPLILIEGSNLQKIEGNFTETNQLSRLTINNPSGVRVNTAIEIKEHLNLVNGIVQIVPGGFLSLMENGIATGASSNSFVQGPMRKKGNTRFVFPIGDHNRLGRVAFSPLSGVASETIIEARYRVSTAPNNTAGDEQPIEAVSGIEYWSVIPWSNNKSGDINGRIELFIEDPEFSEIYFPELILTGWYDQDQNVWRSKGGTAVFNNPTYIRSDIFDLAQSNGLFTFGVDKYGNLSNPLPIELISFTATMQNEEVLLSWITASELNNDYFTIEKSKDGINFEVIGYKDGAGNSSSMQHYDFYDKNPSTGISYYRLKQTDFDGNWEYSETISFYLRKFYKSTMLVYPNPARNGIFRIQLSQMRENETLQLLVSDIYGRLIQHTKIQTDHYGSAYHTIENQGNLIPGVYIVLVQNNNIRLSQRIIIK